MDYIKPNEVVNLNYLQDSDKRPLSCVNGIIIHCSDSDLDVERHRHDDVFDIDSWHRDRGFKCVGYHFVIPLNGSIQLGRPLQYVGAHCKGMNERTIGICYIGGRRGVVACDTRNERQKASMKVLIAGLCSMFNIKFIKSHYEFNRSKVCPCFDADSEYRSLLTSLDNDRYFDENYPLFNYSIY